MILLDEQGNEVKQTSSPKKKLGGLVHKIGYHYCQAASRRLANLGETPPENPLLLREGSGANMIKRINKYGVDEVVRRLNVYMDSEKFVKYPSLNAALAADTYIGIERGTLK